MTIGSGSRVSDPKGVAGFFMYTAEAVYKGAKRKLYVLVDEVGGRITHVHFEDVK